MSNAKVCFEWREKRCKKGTKCRFVHQENLVEACREYQRSGKCRWGKKCAHGHYLGGSKAARPTVPGHQATIASLESTPSLSRKPDATVSTPSTPQATTSNTVIDPLDLWRKVCRVPSPYSPLQMKIFLEGALGIITNKDVGTVQEVIKELADDKNLEHIRQLLDANLSYDGAAGGLNLNLITHAIPFLKIITNTEFQNSIVMERYAGTIYNIIYGHAGTRGIKFFRKILSLSRTLMMNNPDEYLKVFPMIPSALRYMINMNSGAMVQDGVKEIAREALLQAKEQNLLENPTMRNIHQNFKIINEQLELGEQIPSLIPTQPASAGQGGGEGVTNPTLHPAIQSTIRLPGNLSEKGPRHDNDHASIANILILPTAEEIRSDIPEYLPQVGAETVLQDRNQKLLDSQFRLLREDSIGCLRESLRQIIENRGNLEVLQGSRRRRNDGLKRFFTAGVAVLIHQNVSVESITFDVLKGLKVGITFDQPMIFPDDRTRWEWWRNEDFLSLSSLVCILNEKNESVFFTVADRYVTEGDIRVDIPNQDEDNTENRNGPRDQNGPDRKLSTLAGHPLRAGITLSFANDVREADVEWLSRLRYSGSLDSSKIDLIEFPKTLLAAFRPILQGLQKRINKTQSIPFIGWLAPDPSLNYQRSIADESLVDVRPPPYASSPDFFFDLRSILDIRPNVPVRLHPAAAHDFDIKTLLDNTTLDEGQARSLVKALSREVGLIQGPPGTGKSFVGTKIVKVLLANKVKARLGPVLCVCYTNHALDQFLEHLLDTGINNIVRLGSQSKSERLDGYLLKNLVQATENTRVERKEIWELKNKTRRLAMEADEYCETLTEIDSEKPLRAYLRQYHPRYFRALFQRNQDDEGWEVHHGTKKKRFTAWKWRARPGNITRSAQSILASTQDPWSLTPTEIYAVLNYWKSEVLRNAIAGLADVTKQHRFKSEKLLNLKNERDRRLLQGADIIGVTTSSLAGHANMLGRVRAKVLFCEEAGEILEAHTITTLIPSIEHMILIGDHEQLRPHVANYDLSVESKKGQSYRLDVSLFERLVQQTYGNLGLKFPIASLNTQRRMHPTIADLIRIKTYPGLLDTVPNYPPIPGMKKRLFWMNHTHPDSKGDAIKASTSFTNEFEQEIVISLVTHLLHQGVFKEKQIAVLTPYLGQMSRLRRLLGNIMEIVVGSRDQEALDEAKGFLGDEDDAHGEEKKPEDLQPKSMIRKSTLDAAGEEADVVIISLVRSNQEHQCGFLKTSNRINVLLSRAKWGMFIIGDANTAGSVPMWSNVINQMNLNDCLGNALELQCDRHKDTQILASSKEDFITYAPEGGCSVRCEWRLKCGHACLSKCHSATLHEISSCPEPCPKELVGCEHECVGKCGQPCPPCMVTIRDISLKCGHKVTQMPCNRHQKIEEHYCRVAVHKITPGCNHTVSVECARDVTKDFRCTAICGATLPCGHSCRHRCMDCRKPVAEKPDTFETKHGECQKICKKPFNTCNHSCGRKCHGDDPCGLCYKACTIFCQHSRCSSKCKDPCPPCAEQCTLGCEHKRCIMPCGVSCNILPCDQLCTKLLACGHQCPSLCGEACPDIRFCRVCGADKILDSIVDMLEFETYREQADKPMIFLPCGHFYSVSSFDGIANMKDFFEFDSPEGWKITQRYMQEKSEPAIPRCPDCRAPHTASTRYNEIVKKAQLQNSIRQFTLASNQTLISLVRDADSLQDILENSRGDFNAANNIVLIRRHQTLVNLQNRLMEYNKRVLTEEQPYHLVHELAIRACKKYELDPETYNPSVVQYRFGIEGAYQELRVNFLRLCDMDIIARKPSTSERLRKGMWGRIAMETTAAIPYASKLVVACKDRRQQLIEVQTRIILARFVALALKHRDEIGDKTMRVAGLLPGEDDAAVREAALNDLEECLGICDLIPSGQRLKGDVEESIKFIRGAEFYSIVTDKEMKEIYDAMEREFRGTGHWYICPNGHQFTVGECGQPMRIGRCNECGAEIGGQSHISVQGVTRDTDLDTRMQNIQL
ncbi:hypothetical protein TWF481_010782 [Arthrobotrys musiformis]|uniref:NFX1-type zinc finger-containing protein 1 n=1 Tax=Arthrobotrys musiformis TaxID=47236 RepID=A0AAV9W445_9PEZI